MRSQIQLAEKNTILAEQVHSRKEGDFKIKEKRIKRVENDRLKALYGNMQDKEERKEKMSSVKK